MSREKSFPKITILTSFYNVSSFIPGCIAMLKAQTCLDFKVILVDDGSTDGSYEECVNNIGDDPRFFVIRHEHNRGLGSGRITGIENCDTEYLTYVDPDDFLSPDAVQNYLLDIERTKADYIIYDYYVSDGTKSRLVTDTCKTAEELFTTRSSLISHLWHKVVKTELYKRFDYSFLSQVSFAEDLFNSVNCFLNTDRIAIVHKAFYTYRYNANSLVHNRTEKSILENIAVNKNLLKNPKLSEKPYVKKYIERDSFDSFGQLIFPNMQNDFQKKPHFREWISLDRECHIPLPKNLSLFTRLYLKSIRKKLFILSILFWHILRLRNKIRLGK